MAIPKYKRDSFIFISNLKEITASSEFPISLKRNGYLLSECYTSESYEALAAFVKKRRNLLVSDNGNFSRMKKIARKFSQESNLLLDSLKNGQIQIDEALKQRKTLIKKIASHCQELLQTQEKSKIITNQLKIQPDYLICLEDFTIPVLSMCGLLAPEFTPQANEVIKYQEKSTELYNKQKNGDYGNKDKLDHTHKFLVLHSYDYSSANQGALLLKDFNPEGVAISFGGVMQSRRWVTEWDLGDKSFLLPEKLPEMYLATASISLGYLSGHPQDTPIHILGVGSPILIALLGYLFNTSRAVSIDSTAPFKDAFQSNLYGSRYGFMKMDMYKVAAYALINNIPYHSTTPFFRDFENAFPHDWSQIRSELGVLSSTNVCELANLLEKETALVEKYIPFFTKMRSGNDQLIKHLRVARSGHNYWILHCICNSIINRRGDQIRLDKWMAFQINRYKKNAHPKWAKTVEFIYNEVMEIN